MRLAFVVQRYGEEVAGGAEALCRSTARALAAGGDAVDVYTTTARDYLTWAPHYGEGVERDGPVLVRRFDAERPDPGRSGDLVRSLALGGGAPEAEAAWARAQGPVAPGLLRALEARAEGYEAVALWTYLYATTQLAIGLVRERSVLVPLAHDEPMLRFGITRAVVREAAGLAFMTPEERRLVHDLHGRGDRPEAIVGAGLDPAPPGDGARARAALRLPARFALYLGRVDQAKGVDALVRAHERYRRGGRAAGAGAGGAGRRGPAAAALGRDHRLRRRGHARRPARRAPRWWCCRRRTRACRWWRSRPGARAGRPWPRPAPRCSRGRAPGRAAGCSTTTRSRYARQLSRLASDPELRAMLGGRGARFAATQTWDACARRWRALLARVRRPVAARS